MIGKSEWESLSERLSASAFRSRFHLGEKEKAYAEDKGLGTIEEHAYAFVKERLAPAVIPNDGKQTPMKGHPVFIAQHASATCCRSCLEKWHRIEKNRRLSESETDYIVSVIMRFIRSELTRT